MEIYIAVIGIGLIAYLNVLAIRKHQKETHADLNAVASALFDLSEEVEYQHKKTRKDQQEIKTRLTQVRKDLNKGIATYTVKKKK